MTPAAYALYADLKTAHGLDEANNTLVWLIELYERNCLSAETEREALAVVQLEIDSDYYTAHVTPAGQPSFQIKSADDLDELIGLCRDDFDETDDGPIVIRNAAGITVAKITDKNTVIRY